MSAGTWNNCSEISSYFSLNLYFAQSFKSMCWKFVTGVDSHSSSLNTHEKSMIYSNKYKMLQLLVFWNSQLTWQKNHLFIKITHKCLELTSNDIWPSNLWCHRLTINHENIALMPLMKNSRNRKVINPVIKYLRKYFHSTKMLMVQLSTNSKQIKFLIHNKHFPNYLPGSIP